MSQTAQSKTGNGRKLAWERRRAQSQSGKTAINPVQTAKYSTRSGASATTAKSGSMVTARDASRTRREAMSTSGKAAVSSQDRIRDGANNPVQTSSLAEAAKPRDCGCGCKGQKVASGNTASTPAPTPPAGKFRKSARNQSAQHSGRAMSLARRQAMSSKGKAALSNKPVSAAQTVRAANPNMNSRDLAQLLREQRSKNGKAGQKKSEPTGRMRPGKQLQTGGAQDAYWKVGAGETTHGQTVTGTMVGRSTRVTGDEPSTCRAITGTEYLGADIFKQFCQTDAIKSPSKVRVTSTSHGNRVSGNELGRAQKVTGNEPGSCKRVTGNQYVGAEQAEAFCNTKPETTPAKVTSAQTRKGKAVTGNNVGRSSNVTGDESGATRELTGTQYMAVGNGKAPVKVGRSTTLRGGTISGTMVGRNTRVTGDEPGSCRNVTGDDYIGQEQYSGFCEKTPAPTDRKVGASKTLTGKSVTGTMTGRGNKVTGDEPGTCKAVTGTPYAGAEQYESYCPSGDTTMAAARMRRQAKTTGAAMTGLQPGINGKMTGSSKGACEPVSGTPYVGADQFANACPSMPADTNSPDFPQPLGTAAWGQFSIDSPSHAAQTTEIHSAVTGTRYEHGQITGPFGMAGGKVTGTEEARFGNHNHSTMRTPMMETADMIGGRTKSRISGEGMDVGKKITGDDWDRGDNVTGTEGLSATRRNPSRRGEQQAMAMQQMQIKRNEDIATPVSKVTGGSGNTEKGALITYSGGARG